MINAIEMIEESKSLLTVERSLFCTSKSAVRQTFTCEVDRVRFFRCQDSEECRISKIIKIDWFIIIIIIIIITNVL